MDKPVYGNFFPSVSNDISLQVTTGKGCQIKSNVGSYFSELYTTYMCDLNLHPF